MTLADLGIVVENKSGVCGWCKQRLLAQEQKTHNTNCKVRAYCMGFSAPATVAANLSSAKIQAILNTPVV